MPFRAELEGNGKLPNGHSGHMSQAVSGLKSFSGIYGSESRRLLLDHYIKLAVLMLI